MFRRRGYWSWVILCVLIGTAVRARAVAVGFHMDDFAQLAMLAGQYPVERSTLDLFSFATGRPDETLALMSRGVLPWWTDPTLRLSALRPLSSALMWADVGLFGRDPVAHHVHSLVWWGATVLGAGLVLRRLLPTRWAAIAIALYAFDECHNFPIAWAANRNALVSASLGFLAFWAHLRWREDGARWGLGVALAGTLLSLAGGEYALCLAAFLFAYEVFLGPGDGWTRARALVPAGTLMLGFVVIHRVLGFGAHGSKVYVDPIGQPLGYVLAAAERLPVLLADMYLAVPSGRLGLHFELDWLPTWGGPIVVAAVGLGYWAIGRCASDRSILRLRWAFVASLIALLPVASSFLSARLLVVAALAGHVVVAAIILSGWDWARTRRVRGWGRGLVAALMLVGHLGFAGYWGWTELNALQKINAVADKLCATVPTGSVEARQRRFVVFGAVDPMTVIYPPFIRWVGGVPFPRAWWVLSMAPSVHEFTRVSETAFELEVLDGAMMRTGVERLFRHPDAALKQGDRVELDGMTVEVLETASEGGVTKARFSLERSLNDPSVVFVLTTPRGFVRYPVGRVGSRTKLAAPTDPGQMDI